MGRAQAENMGANFRQLMYPDVAGGGVLRLHSTYRHDLKIKASDEGRVMKTAAAFAKGLLELEGQLTPIIASLVTVEAKNKSLLDYSDNAAVKEDLDDCKEHLNHIQREYIDDEFVNTWAKDCPASKASNQPDQRALKMPEEAARAYWSTVCPTSPYCRNGGNPAVF